MTDHRCQFVTFDAQTHQLFCQCGNAVPLEVLVQHVPEICQDIRQADERLQRMSNRLSAKNDEIHHLVTALQSISQLRGRAVKNAPAIARRALEDS